MIFKITNLCFKDEIRICKIVTQIGCYKKQCLLKNSFTFNSW